MNLPTTTFLIVDDEELARVELRRQLTSLVPTFTCLEAGNLQEARAQLLDKRVNGVFLDLEMPGGHGMSFLPELQAMEVPVVLVTAHDRYAVEAYDGNVCDYLLKPIERTRLARALARIRQPEQDFDRKLLVLGDQSGCWPMYMDEIILIETQGTQSLFHLKDRTPILIPCSLKEIEQSLDPKQFVRVNRSQIVRLHCMKMISRREGSGNFESELEGHGMIEFSRRQSQAFRQRFGF
jgi:two-component system LytT family response regulator